MEENTALTESIASPDRPAYDPPSLLELVRTRAKTHRQCSKLSQNNHYRLSYFFITTELQPFANMLFYSVAQ